MTKTFPLIVGASLFAVVTGAWAAGGQGRPTPAPAAPTAKASVTDMNDVLKAVRDDLQGDRSDLMAKNLTLTSAQAAKFWPMFDSYLKEQSAIMDEQLAGIQRFIESYDTLDDAGALGLVKTHLDRDIKMATLRQTWLPRFQQVLGAKLGARVVQIDRRLSLVQQLYFTTKIPLSH